MSILQLIRLTGTMTENMKSTCQSVRQYLRNKHVESLVLKSVEEDTGEQRHKECNQQEEVFLQPLHSDKKDCRGDAMVMAEMGLEKNTHPLDEYQILARLI